MITALNSSAQIDTVVLRKDSMFESKFHRKLHDKRTNIKYHLEEIGNIRDMAVYLAELQILATGEKMFAVRIDERLNRNILSDAPFMDAEYIDEDELQTFIGYLNKIKTEIMTTPHTTERYAEYRFYTRAGFMLECFTGANRWRCLLHYEIGEFKVDTYISNPDRIDELIATISIAVGQIKTRRQDLN